MRSVLLNFTLTLLILLGIQSVFGQQNIENTIEPESKPTQNFCFNIANKAGGFCPVGENVAFGTPLLEAIRQRDVTAIKRLISEGANVNEVGNRGLLPLILVANGDFELIDILLKANASINIEGLYGATPLGTSTICSAAVKRFLEAGAEVDFRKDNRPTALMLAAGIRNIESVKLLLNSGANIHARDFDGMTPLLHAIRGGNIEITKLLYDRGGKKDFSDEGTAAIALSITAGNSQPEMMRFLLQSGINPNVRGKYGSTAITMAAMRSNAEVVRLLIEAGADVNIKGPQTQSPLAWASQYGSIAIVEFLLRAKADVNDKSNWSPLINAARNNHIEIMKMLFKAGANINKRGYEGKTALMDAACRSKVETVKFLIESGADVNLVDDEETALSLSTKCGRSNIGDRDEIVKILLNAGAVSQ